MCFYLALKTSKNHFNRFLFSGSFRITVIRPFSFNYNIVWVCLLLMLFLHFFAGQDHHEVLKILVHRAVFSMTMDLVLKVVLVYMDHSIHFVHAFIVIMIRRIVKLIHFSGAPTWDFHSAKGKQAFYLQIKKKYVISLFYRVVLRRNSF